jgi:hypothetical protein
MPFIKSPSFIGTLSSILLILAIPAKAATVTGSVTGTWDSSGIAGINPNDAFTANYAYDTSNLLPYDNSGSDLTNIGYLITPLISLQITSSNNINHVFDLANGGGSVLFEDYSATPPTYSPARFQAFTLVGIDSIYSFSAYHQVGLDNGLPFEFKQIRLDTSEGSLVAQSNATFTSDSVTPVPTPVLLPGLVGVGASVLYRRRKVLNRPFSS